MNREGDQAAVLHEVNVDVGVLEVLEEDAPHPILEADPVIVFLVLLLGLLIRPDLPPVVR